MDGFISAILNNEVLLVLAVLFFIAGGAGIRAVVDWLVRFLRGSGGEKSGESGGGRWS